MERRWLDRLIKDQARVGSLRRVIMSNFEKIQMFRKFVHHMYIKFKLYFGVQYIVILFVCCF